MTTTEILPLVRRGILAVLAFGCVGLLAELVLLEHYAEWYQLPPLVLCTLTLASIVWHWTSSGATSVRALQISGLMLVVAGVVGIGLHFGANYDDLRADEPLLAGLDFWKSVVKGEHPTLAPGTLVQFGLLALLYSYKHPALNKSA
jgi:hypothetical protein